MVVPLESEPADVVNRTLAPVTVKPVGREESVTASGCASAVPAVPVWLLPDLMANAAAGLPTTIHPPSVWVDVPSLPVTV